MKLTERERDTLLAALRHWKKRTGGPLSPIQRYPGWSRGLGLTTNGREGKKAMLDGEEIEKLWNRLRRIEVE